MPAMNNNIDQTVTFAQFLGDYASAFAECSDDVQAAVREMFTILHDPESDADEKAMAARTIADAVALNPHKGLYGMDLADSEREAAAKYPELADAVREMDQEEATFADNLQGELDLRGMTQSELARLVGVGQPAISNMLRRECRPQKKTVVKIAEALGVEPEQLWPNFSR